MYMNQSPMAAGGVAGVPWCRRQHSQAVPVQVPGGGAAEVRRQQTSSRGGVRYVRKEQQETRRQYLNGRKCRREVDGDPRRQVQ